MLNLTGHLSCKMRNRTLTGQHLRAPLCGEVINRLISQSGQFLKDCYSSLQMSSPSFGIACPIGSCAWRGEEKLDCTKVLTPSLNPLGVVQPETGQKSLNQASINQIQFSSRLDKSLYTEPSSIRCRVALLMAEIT